MTEHFAVKFPGSHEPDKLMGAFLTIDGARRFAQAECDGQRWTIHRIDLPEVVDSSR